MGMPRLSLCAIVLNEEEMLPGMLASVDGLVDEIILGVDTRTTDRTVVCARPYGARIIDVEWQDDFSRARNLTVDAATGKWILVLDADERLLSAGVEAIRNILDNAAEVPAPDATTGFAFWIDNREISGTTSVQQLGSSRLFRNRPEIRYQGIIHEEIVWLPEPENTTCMIAQGRPHIVHYGYDPTLYQQRGKAERNRLLLERRDALASR